MQILVASPLLRSLKICYLSQKDSLVGSGKFFSSIPKVGKGFFMPLYGIGSKNIFFSTPTTVINNDRSGLITEDSRRIFVHVKCRKCFREDFNAIQVKMRSVSILLENSCFSQGQWRI